MGSILFCLQNGTLIDPRRQVRYWTAVARLFHGIRICASMEEAGSMEEADLVMRIPVTTY
jgi:hypothetical protein